MQRTAFVDESVRRQRYLLTMVDVANADLSRVRRSVDEVAPGGSRRTHFSAESDRRRKVVLGHFMALADEALIMATVFVAPYLGGDDQFARDPCLRALVVACESRSVSRLVLDSRHVERDRVDRRTIAAAVRGPALPDAFEYTHRGSRDEPSLSLPDAIGWAWGAGGQWRRRVASAVLAEIPCG